MDRGILVHLFMTYPALVPYLKGFHLTLEMWRPDRDSNGWKMSATDWIRLQDHFLSGNSKSLSLFRLVLRLRKLQLNFNFKLHVFHVDGTRMIEQGSDGLSRGLPFEGLIGDKKDFLSYLPLDKTALERSSKLKPWIKS